MNGPAQNTDRELYREDTGNPAGSYYENSLLVTVGGAIGMNVGGRVIVQPIAAWHGDATRERYPHVSGDIVVLGPECIYHPGKDVIAYKGEVYASPPTAFVEVVRSGYMKGCARVEGRCPACGTRALALGSGCRVTCGNPTCPDPSAVDDYLDPHPDSSPAQPTEPRP